MKKRLSLASLLLLFATLATAQNTGYAGRRVLLKADVVNGLRGFGSAVHLELVPLRKLTLSVGYNFGSYQVAQEYNGIDYPSTSSSYSEMPEEATIEPHLMVFELRKYHGKAMLGAPRGPFLYANIATGKTDIIGSFYQGMIEPRPGGELDQTIRDYTYSGANQFTWEIGWGYQGFITSRVTLGGKIGYTSTTLESIEGDARSEWLLTGVRARVGHNGFDGSSDEGRRTSHAGISFTLQLGYMIF